MAPPTESKGRGERTGSRYRTRRPQTADGAAMDRLVRNSPPLDVNSRYLYLLLCRDFAETCIVAEAGGELVGFITAFLRPTRPDTVFVWQVAVDRSMRGCGVAGGMLDALLLRDACRGVRYLETSVTPSNTASRRMFEKLAERRGVKLAESGLFGAGLLGDDGEHEEERLLRLGPFETAPTPDSGDPS